jgi:small subunit ribosomal protein S17
MNAKELNNMEKELENMNEDNAVIQEMTENTVEVTDVVTEVSQPVSEVIEELPMEIEETPVKFVEKKISVAVEAPSNEKKSNKRVLMGKVVSNKPDKTIIIKVERQVAHPIYKKYYKKTNKFMAHDELNTCNIGDIVRVKECRPLSARKCWELVEVVERAK